MGMHRRIDVVWMLSDAIKGLFSMDIGRSSTKLMVGIAGKEWMFE